MKFDASPADLAVEIDSLSSEILERYEEVSLIYRLSERLGAVIGRRAVSRLVLEEAAQVLQARGGELWIREEDQILRVASYGTVPPPLSSVDRPLQDAVERGRVYNQEPESGAEARLIVPLPAPGSRPCGAIVLRGRAGGEPFRTGQVKLLSALATLTSAFLRNHQLAEAARDADLRRRDSELARQIHRSLLPACETRFAGIETAGVSYSAEKIGGDCYDYLPFADGSLGLLIADVSGHGVAAALYMAALKGALQAASHQSSDPAELLTRTNAVLAANFDRTEMFATAFLFRVEPGGRRWSYSGAGHPEVLCLRGNGGLDRFESSATALGLFEETVFETRQTTLAPEDRLILYTDGLTEARDPQGKLYGIDRLIRTSHAGFDQDAAGLRRRILEDVETHTEHRGVRDDVTLVVAHPQGDGTCPINQRS